jgi:hypothetical protein
MKMMFKKTILYTLALMGLMACNDGDSVKSGAAEAGYLSFAVATTENVENITRAQITIGDATTAYTAPASADFSIVITNEDGENVWSGLIGEWDATTPLKEGNYSVKASFNNGSAVGANNPIFDGSADFAIVGGETKTVEIPVKLKNALVRLSFSDMFKNYYAFEKFTITSNGTTIDYLPTDSNAVFIEVGEFTVSATLTSQAQVTSTKNFTYTAKAAQCYTIAFDASNIGGNGFTITFGNEPTETVDFGDIDVNE